MYLDPRGHLIHFRAVPPYADFSAAPSPAPDWGALFEASGLDIGKFTPTAPTIQPQVFGDNRMAWNGTLVHLGDEPVRVEAAAFRGKAIYFERVVPSDPHWSAQTEDARREFQRSFRPLFFVVLVLFALLAGGTVLLAMRNIRLGRGDRKGAARIGILMFGLQMLYCLLTEHHVADVAGEILLIALDFSGAVALGVVFAVLYLALEPYVRRLWPEAIVSWSRLLSGQFWDPLVGRDVLVGMAIMSALMVLMAPISWVQLRFDLGGLSPFVSAPGFFRGGRYAVGELLNGVSSFVGVGLVQMMFLLILRIVLRRAWIAGVAFCLIYTAWLTTGTAMWTPSATGVVVVAMLSLLIAAACLVLLVRFGLIAMIAGMFAANTIFPFTTDVSAPYFGISLMPVAAVLAFALYAFKISLAGQSLLGDDILEVGVTPRR